MNDKALTTQAIQLAVASLRAEYTTLKYDASRVEARGHRLLALDMRQMADRLGQLAQTLDDVLMERTRPR